jgi:hypothetical protein
MGPSIFLIFASLLGSPSEGDDIDIRHFDKSPKSRKAQKTEKFRNHIGPVQASQRDIQLPTGDTYFGKLQLPLKPDLDLPNVQIKIVPTTKSKAFLIFEYPVQVALLSNTKNRLEIIYAIQNKTSTPIGKYAVRLNVEIHAHKTKKRLLKKKIYHRIKITSPNAIQDTTTLDHQAFDYFQKQAMEKKRGLGKMRQELSMQSIRYQVIDLSKKDRPLIRAFLYDRIRADVAYRRLKQRAQSKTSAFRIQAIRALANLAHFDDQAKRRLRYQLSEPDLSLKHALLALEDFDFHDSHLLASRARNSGKLNRKTLSRALAVLAAIELIRKPKSPKVRPLVGQAFCLNPKLKTPIRLSMVKREFEDMRKSPPCPNGIIVGQVVATRRIENGLNMVDVTGEFGPDPYELVSGGNIELWGAGGEIIETAKIRARHGEKNTLISSFEDRGDIQNYVGQILIRLLVKDLSGVDVAVFGQDEAIPIDIDESNLSFTRHIDWWMWALAGAVILAGSATAILSVVDTDPQRGVGPISIRF